MRYETIPGGVCVMLDDPGAQGHQCRISYHTKDILRVCYSFDESEAPRASYAVILPRTEVTVTCEETAEGLMLRTETSAVQVCLSPFCITVLDSSSTPIHQDLAGKAYLADRNGRRHHHFQRLGMDDFYGLGEKSGALNKAGRRLRNDCRDTLGYDAEASDPLYKHIPFFIMRDRAANRQCGMFYDCTVASTFDLGCERSNYWPPYAYFSCDSGPIDSYLILGDSIRDIVRRYTDLTGKTAMPPLHSLGFLASTMYFTELDVDADRAIEAFVDEMDANGLGFDAFLLSSGYTARDGKRYVFTWNHDRFPDPVGFIDRMHERGVPLSPNIKPALLTTHPLYETFAKAGAFLTDASTGNPHLERFWGGMASHVDFTAEAGRAMWSKYMAEQLVNLGITALWDDNNEYELTGDDARCDAGGKNRPASDLRSVMPNLMAQTAIETLRAHDPMLRPFILSRAGYAGIQRYAQTWAGDNRTSWNTLRYNIPTMLGMGLSGVANQGCDIGGFDGPAPDAELFVRWVQNGVFQPRFCIHSCNTDNTVTLPWNYPDHMEIIRNAFALRYRLGLYLYSLMRQAATQGDPILRPMVYAFGEDPRTADTSFDFMFGPSLLVACVVEPGAQTRQVYLPRGCAWYDWYTHERYEGGQLVTLDAPLDRIPMLYCSGSILPLVDPRLRMRVENFASVMLRIEASEASSFTLYQDDGVSNAFQDGAYLETRVDVQPEAEVVQIRFTPEGTFPNVTQRYEVELCGREAAPLSAAIGQEMLPVFLSREQYATAPQGLYFDLATRHAWIKFDNRPGAFVVGVSYVIKDLVGI